MSFPDRLKKARRDSGLTQQQVAESLGVDKTTYSGYETGRRQPDVPKLRMICQMLHLSGDELLETGHGKNTGIDLAELRHIQRFRALDSHGKELVELVLDKEFQRITQKEPKEREDSGWITHINCYDLAVSAGTGEPWGDTAYKTRLEIPGERVPEKAHFCVRVNGDSMEPVYKDGDIVFVERLDGFVKEGEIGIFVLNGDGYIKRLGRRELISLNPNYVPIPVGEYDDLRCQGRVLGKL